MKLKQLFQFLLNTVHGNVILLVVIAMFLASVGVSSLLQLKGYATQEVQLSTEQKLQKENHLLKVRLFNVAKNELERQAKELQDEEVKLSREFCTTLKASPHASFNWQTDQCVTPTVEKIDKK